MYDQIKLFNKIERIRLKIPMSILSMSRELGIGVMTYRRMYKGELVTVQLKTIRKMKKFLERYKNNEFE